MRTFHFLALLIIVINSNAQTIIEGSVFDFDTKRPLPYATIEIEGQFIGTISNVNGEFSLVVPQIDDVRLKVSSMGYESRLVDLNHEKYERIFLKPSTILLETVTVDAEGSDAREIVKKAFESIEKNYLTEPFLMKGFYRHYCKEDSLSGRLIEAAVDIYKPKGYSSLEKKMQEEVRLVQLRRSLDHTKFKNRHAAIAVSSVICSDVASYSKAKRKTGIDSRGTENFIQKNQSSFNFHIADVTVLEGNVVYVIGFEQKDQSAPHNKTYRHNGKLFIDSEDFAILKYEHNYGYGYRLKIRDMISYKKENGKYLLFHSIHEQRDAMTNHDAHVELLVNEVLIGEENSFEEEPITSYSMSKIKYEPSFWQEYNVIKINPLESDMVVQLERDVSLDNQFESMQESQKKLYSIEVQSDLFLHKKIKEASESHPVYVDFWATWCAPCLSGFFNSKDVIREYEDKGVKFFFVSLDEQDDIKKRSSVLKAKLGFTPENNFWMSDVAPLAQEQHINAIPRYMIFHKGKLIDGDAPEPHTPAFRAKMDQIIHEKP